MTGGINEGETSPRVVWLNDQVAPAERHHLLGQYPMTLWLTGLSAAGKSALAFALERILINQGRACCVLDGDNVRHGLNSNLGFSATDRTENIRRVAEVARLMNDAGLIVVVALISPNRDDRAAASRIIGVDKFREVYVSTSLAVCESRDPKGLYSKVRAGTLAEFTGISAPYEQPVSPALEIDTLQLPLEQAVSQLLALIPPYAPQQ